MKTDTSIERREHHLGRSEDYLKSIYLLDEDGQAVGFAELAGELSVSPSSVTTMLKRLSAMGLVKYRPYSDVTLTAKGKTAALEVIRHHRLLESFLHRVLGYPLSDVHDEAEVLEHIISERFEERMDEVLGRPATDPHGSPIPGRDLSMARSVATPLTESPVGVPLQVSGLDHRESDRLRYLEELGIVPDAVLTLTERRPLSEPLTVRLRGGRLVTIGHDLGSKILVRPRAGHARGKP